MEVSETPFPLLILVNDSGEILWEEKLIHSNYRFVCINHKAEYARNTAPLLYTLLPIRFKFNWRFIPWKSGSSFAQNYRINQGWIHQWVRLLQADSCNASAAENGEVISIRLFSAYVFHLPYQYE